jgi:hypothetical protein
MYSLSQFAIFICEERLLLLSTFNSISICYLSLLFGLMSKSVIDNSFDSVSAVSPGREGWRLKVRVLRLWEVPIFLNPEQPNSIEMVLIDDKVVLIIVVDLCLFSVLYMFLILLVYHLILMIWVEYLLREPQQITDS